jgi:hypothetical protein
MPFVTSLLQAAQKLRLFRSKFCVGENVLLAQVRKPCRCQTRAPSVRIVDIRDGVRDEAAALDAAWAWVKLAPIGASSTSMDEIVARVHAQWPGLTPETIRAEILKRYGEK